MTQLVRGFETPVTAWDQDTTWQLNIASPTIASPGDPEVGVTFMVPASGRVMVIVGGGGRDNTGNNRVFLFPEVFIGTQAVPENESGLNFDQFIIPGEADLSMYGSRISILTSLTPLAVHYARVVFSVDGDTVNDTADIFVRELLVSPLP